MQKEVTRTLLAVISISALIIASLWVLRPFLSSIIWAATLVIATWPLMLMLQRAFRGHRLPAIIVMTLAMLLLLIVPFWLAIEALVEQLDQVGTWSRSLANFQFPAPPQLLADIPLVGEKLMTIWQDAAAGGWGLLAAKAQPYIVQIMRKLATEVGTVGTLIVQFLLTVLVAAVMYAKGEQAASAIKRFGLRLAGERGVNAVLIAGQAVRGVALGVVVTALVQSALAGLGLYFIGVPLAGGLTVAIMMLCIAQLGPLPVLLPAVGWVYMSGNHTAGTILLVWTVIVGSLDNFLRPMLIKRGADLPLILIFAGVIGGLLSFGLLGIFVGPVVLAVSYKLLEAWMNEPGSVAASHPDQTPGM